MKIIQSPKNMIVNYRQTRLFLAGGISNCPNWQEDVCNIFLEKYDDNKLYIINPRRVGDLVKNGEEAKEQILWEHEYLAQATHILFWFPKETVCPITLFELGKYVTEFSGFFQDINKVITIGVHPEYPRRFDLEVQLPLIDPHINIVYSIEEMVSEVATKLNLTLKEKI